MDAIFDIGNTNTKVAFLLNKAVDETLTFPTSDFTNFYRYLSAYQFRSCIISTVVELPEHLIHYLKTKSTRFFILNAGMKLPVKLNYETPETLGNDRIALVCGAAIRYPEKDVLVINAGTCITYNLLTAQAEFKGGAISPGLQMRLKAMHEMTDGLPQVSVSSEDISIVAINTEHSLLSGALHGACFEMMGYINYLKHTFPNLEVLLCGGDSRYFEKLLPIPVRIEDDLAFAGLHKILSLNV